MNALEGLDPELGSLALATTAFARVVAFPLVRMRRRELTDTGEARTGRPYLPKALQTLTALGVCIVGNVIAGVATGKPPIHAAVTAATGCILAMVAYDAQHKRAP